MKTRFLVLICLAGLVRPSAGQSNKLDSLYNILSHYTQNDSIKVKIIFNLCRLELAANREAIPKLAEEALAISKKINYTDGIGISYTYMALYHRANGEYDKVADYALKMVDVFEHSANEDGLGQAYNMLGVAHFEWKNYEKAQFYQEKSLEVHRRSGQKFDMNRNYINLGMIFSETGRHDQAIQSFLKALALNEEFHNEQGICIAYINLGQAHVNKKDYPLAISYYDKAFSMAGKNNDDVALAAIHVGLAEAYSGTGQYEKGIKNADSSLSFAKKLKDKTRIRDSYRMLADIEKLRNNYKASLEYRELSFAFNDSIYTENKLKQFTDLEAKYEAEKKQQTINLLEQEDRVKLLFRNLLLMGIISLLLIGALVFYFQRQKNKRNQELLKKQEELNQKLQEIDQLKSRFFANISHEFRTPLTLIMGPLEMMKQEAQPKPGMVESMLRNSKRLLRLVNQLLDLSKIEGRQMPIHASRGNLDFIKGVVHSFESLADQRGISLDVQMEEALPSLYRDREVIEKIMFNLLSNAIKFTLQGGVSVRILFQNDKLRIEVHDTGIGIPEKELPRIFDRFYQIDSSSSREYPGTGIGLALAKELSQLHHGSLTAISAENKGTTFVLELPTQDSSWSKEEIVETDRKAVGYDADVDSFSESGHETDHETDITGLEKCILVVEDHPDVRDHIRENLSDEYRIIEARNGIEGFEKAIENTPDLIVSDVMMPKKDGISLTRELKTDIRTSHIPVILLTARASEDHKMEGLETGADDYLIKPFNIRELKTRIGNFIRLREVLIEKYSKRFFTPDVTYDVENLNDRFLKQVSDVLNANLSNPDFGVETLAENLAMSRSQLYRKMVALTRMNPTDMLRKLRLEKAKILLEKNAGNIAQVAFEVGFNNLSYFTKCFRQEFGKNPSQL